MLAFEFCNQGDGKSVQILCIVGDSRSGSTLLQALLSQRAGVVGLGELRRLEPFWTENRNCNCGARMRDCDFWSGVMADPAFSDRHPRTQPHARRFAKLLGEAAAFAGYVTNMRSTSRLLLPLGRRVAADVTRVYRAIVEHTGADTLVDASKDPGHFLYLDQLSGLDVRPILLIRDGRAVVWSKIRRTGIDPLTAIDHWARITRMQLALSHWRRQSRPAIVHYEILCNTPAQTLNDLLPGRRFMVTDDGGGGTAGDRHHIGGTPEFRLTAGENPRPDLRWVDEMPDDVLSAFERRVGRLNSRLGYSTGRETGFVVPADHAGGDIGPATAWPVASVGGR